MVSGQAGLVKGRFDVRFGSKADSCSAATHVRFTPNSDRKSRHPQTAMSALPLKADMCTAQAHVCFGPKADIATKLVSRRDHQGTRRSVDQGPLYGSGRWSQPWLHHQPL